MRTCQSCGRQNPPDRDFCECGEYLRWEPTGIVQAVTPASEAVASPPGETGAAAATDAPPEPAPGAPPAAPAPVPPPPPPPSPPAAASSGGTLVQGAGAPPPAAPFQAAPAAEAVESATITLRLPDEEAEKGEALAVGVHPGDRTRVKALIRNQSGIVDNYQLRVEGLPEGWWSVLPDLVYLVPYGTGGTYEQEVEIHLHPPRAPEAEARIWELEVVAHSKAQERTAATAPLLLGIQPFEEHNTKVKPERATGRRKADFDVAVANKANAPVLVAFDATEADNECGFDFKPPTAEIQPGHTVTTKLRVRPPKQIWIGRPHERKIDVATKTGDEAAAIAAATAEDDGADDLDGEGVRGKLRGKKVPGVYGPKIYKPQVHKPNIHLGPGGLQVSKPMVRGPQVVGPRARGMNLNLNNLKMPGQAPPSITGPLLPTQAVFRQKPWLPWWVAIVIPLLALLALLLFLFLPKNATVPDVVGKPSAFEAEKLVTGAKLKLAAKIDERVDPDAPPGSVLEQAPKAGEKVEEGKEVTLLVAVGDGKITVPDLVKMTPGEAEKALREKGLSLGQTTPQPVDPEAVIASHIPAAKEIVKEGAPVDIFTVDPAAAKADKKGGGANVAVAPTGGDEQGGDEQGGEGEGGPIVVPPIEGDAQDAYTQKVGDRKLIPVVKKEFNEAKKGAIIRVKPEPGEEIEAGKTVTVFVSAGFPKLVYDDEQDVLLRTGSRGKELDPIAKGPQKEQDPAWSADATRIAFASDGRVFLKDLTKQDATPQPLTKEGESFRDLAWAPTAEVNVLASVKEGAATSLADAETFLCFTEIGADDVNTRCKDKSENVLGRKMNWSPDGRTLLVFGASPDAQRLGMISYTSRTPFSANPEDWESRGFVSDVSKPGEGAIDAAFSPDGKRLATVVLSNGKTNLFLGKKKDFLLSEAKPLGVRACKAIWRTDGLEIVVVRSDTCLQSETGELLRFAVAEPKVQTSLGLNGDNAVFQPLAVE